MKYQVTWGELISVVEAPNEADARAAFCDQNDAARKRPNQHKFTFAKVAPKVEAKVLSAAVTEPKAKPALAKK